MGAPLVATSPIFAICFLGNAIGKRLQQKTPDEVLGPGQLAAAGALSGVMSTIVMAPGERIKCLLQVSHRCIYLEQRMSKKYENTNRKLILTFVQLLIISTIRS